MGLCLFFDQFNCLRLFYPCLRGGFVLYFLFETIFTRGWKQHFSMATIQKMLQHIQSNNKNNREVTYDNRGQAESVSGTGDYLFVFYFVCFLSEGITINNYFPKTISLGAQHKKSLSRSLFHILLLGFSSFFSNLFFATNSRFGLLLLLRISIQLWPK